MSEMMIVKRRKCSAGAALIPVYGVCGYYKRRKRSAIAALIPAYGVCGYYKRRKRSAIAALIPAYGSYHHLGRKYQCQPKNLLRFFIPMPMRMKNFGTS
ncbi:MAG: hypothetical protein U1F76_30080 [Candidatus Competibacteraceae bacterium]